MPSSSKLRTQTVKTTNITRCASNLKWCVCPLHHSVYFEAAVGFTVCAKELRWGCVSTFVTVPWTIIAVLHKRHPSPLLKNVRRICTELRCLSYRQTQSGSNIPLLIDSLGSTATIYTFSRPHAPIYSRQIPFSVLRFICTSPRIMITNLNSTPSEFLARETRKSHP